MSTLISSKRSIIPACDVPTLAKLEELVEATAKVNGIGAYKVGFELGLAFGLPSVVETIRKHSDLPVIYDHQKAGTDIPDTGKKFAATLKNAGIDCAILFPQAGPVTQAAWIEAHKEISLAVMVGGLMTHKSFIRSDGGYLSDESVNEVYQNAAESGVTDFVVPGNKPEAIRSIRKTLEEKGARPVFYSPGFVTQGGSIDEAVEATDGSLHAFVGRGIYEAENMNEAARKLCEAIL